MFPGPRFSVLGPRSWLIVCSFNKIPSTEHPAPSTGNPSNALYQQEREASSRYQGLPFSSMNQNNPAAWASPDS